MKKLVAAACLLLIQEISVAQTPDLVINWDKTIMISKSIATLQVVTNSKIRRSSPIHNEVFDALQNLGADYVRYGVWYPYPKLAVAELKPPDDQKTYWDFSLIDPMLIDFLNATKGHPSVLNFPTVPQWMYKTDKPVLYPEDPDEIYFGYSGGNELRDSTMTELGDYFARLISWYTRGGFTDELGNYHHSWYTFPLPYWEVLNETELEHGLTPEQYTRQYDAIVSAIKKVSPETKFVGMATPVYWNPYFFEYFLNQENHQPGIPIDMISYHFYAGGSPEQEIEDYQFTYYHKADHFISCVRYIENIRERLSPNVKTAINELGTFLTDEMRKQPIPQEYWNLSAGVYAYLYIELTKLGIYIIGQSQLVGYPGQFPDVSMMNWENGKPNARYWVLKMIIENFGPGDSLVETSTGIMTELPYEAQGFITKTGKKILLVNKRNRPLQIKVPSDFKGAELNIVSISSGENKPIQKDLKSLVLEMEPYSVIVATLSN